MTISRIDKQIDTLEELHRFLRGFPADSTTDIPLHDIQTGNFRHAIISNKLYDFYVTYTGPAIEGSSAPQTVTDIDAIVGKINQRMRRLQQEYNQRIRACERTLDMINQHPEELKETLEQAIKRNDISFITTNEFQIILEQIVL